MEDLLEKRKKLICELVEDEKYVPMKEKELAIFMQVKPEDRRELKRILEELLEEGKIEQTTELHEANNLLASQIIMEALVDDSMDAKQRTEAAKSIASLQRAQVSNEKLKIEARKEQGAVHVAMDLLKEKVFSEIGQNYPEIAAKLLELAENTEKELTRMQ